MQTSLIVLHAPPHIRSRLMGLLTVCIGMGPLGILLIGVLADRFGPLLAVDIMAATGLVAVSAIGLAWRRNDLRQRARPTRPDWPRKTDLCQPVRQCHTTGGQLPCKTSA